MRLPPEEIFRYALEAGFSPDQAVTMTAIALAESGGNPEAHNPVGEDSIGLWQVNREAHPDFAGLDGTDPLTNARMAYEVSGHGADIGRWTVTHADRGAAYLRYQAQAEAAADANGYPDAEGQWNPPDNYYSPKVSAGPPGDGSAAVDPTLAAVDAPAEGVAAVPGDGGLDADADGLVTQYEQAVGTDPDAVDTDRDGFADSVELLAGTDPLDFASNPLVVPTDDPTGFRPDLTTTTPMSPTGPGPDGSPAAPAGTAPAGTTPGTAPAVSPAAAAVTVAATAADAPTADPVTAAVTEPGALDTFLDAALSQDGAPYIFGSEVDPTDPDPQAAGDAFDCSELIEWAAARAGVDVPDGSYNQYLHLRDLGTELTVDEALRTPGALVFNFSSEPVPGGGRPSQAHVAISLGDGRLVEARGRDYGVGQFDAEGREFSHAAYIPDLGTEVTATLAGVDGTVLADPLPTMWDSDSDGLLDAYEQMITIDPFAADTDRDGFLDGVELVAHTDPLDFADNPVVAGATGTGGFRPPLTTEAPPLTQPLVDPGWDLPEPASSAQTWGSQQLPALHTDQPDTWADDLFDTPDDAPTDEPTLDDFADDDLTDETPDDDDFADDDFDA